MDSAAHPVVGVAWKRDRTTETFVATCRAIEIAGGTPVLLDQVMSASLAYDAGGTLIDAKDENGVLTAEAARRVRRDSWRGSNVEAVMAGITAVVFPGGEDISPTLFREPQPLETREPVSAERDVSDYLLMDYCLENDIALLAVCRGIQVLGVVEGTGMIQDIPEHMARLGLDGGHIHRNRPDATGAIHSFARHDVRVTDRKSLLYRVVGTDVIENVPSWHHQAITNVEGTRLSVTGVSETDGLIEAAERPDRRFVLGIQFHPEIDAARERDENALKYFRAIVEATM